MLPIEELKNNLNNLKLKWQNLTKRQRAVSVAMLGIVIALGCIIGGLGMKADYVPLYANLEPNEAGKITSYLKDRNTSYELSDEGKTILVPEEDVYDLRLSMAEEEVAPVSGKGFELFDEASLGSTEFEKQLGYQRALQEELQRTIIQIKQIKQARVHLVIPEPSVFIEEVEDATASIFLQLEPTAQLEEAQVKSVVNLAAGSVKGLEQENVTVIDSTGMVLTDKLDSEDPFSEGADFAKQQLEIKRFYESELENRIQRTLEKVYGPGKVVVMATAELDFDTMEAESIVYGDEPVIREQSILEEEYFSEGGEPPGEAGTDSNIPSYYAQPPQGDSEHFRREEHVQNEIDKSIERTIEAPGAVERISMGVIIDDQDVDVARVAGEGEGEEIVELVSSAGGLDMERGDSIEVQLMPFNTEREDRATEALEIIAQQEAHEEMIRNYIVGGIAGLLLLALVMAFVIYRRRKADDELIEEAQVAVGESEEKEEEESDELQSASNEIHEKVKKMADKDPDNFIQLLKTWLSEE